jgi:hypothetical protein
MRTRLFTFTLAVFALGALGACSSESTGSTTTSGSGGSGTGSGTTGSGGGATGTGGAGGGSTSTSTSTGTGTSTSTSTGDPSCDTTYTCAEALDGDPSKLCDGPSGDAYDKYYACVCEPGGKCVAACGDNACKDGSKTVACTQCLQATTTGCAAEFEACASDI